MLNTAFLLASMYEGRPVIPLATIRTDWFPHLTMDIFQRKLSAGDIRLPVLRIENSQKSPKGVHLSDLALYLDERKKEASAVLLKMAG